MIDFRFAKLKGHPSNCTIHQNLGCVQKIQLLEVGWYPAGPRSFVLLEATENIDSKILIRPSLYMKHRFLYQNSEHYGNVLRLQNQRENVYLILWWGAVPRAL